MIYRQPWSRDLVASVLHGPRQKLAIGVPGLEVDGGPLRHEVDGRFLDADDFVEARSTRRTQAAQVIPWMGISQSLAA